jgi:ketosteroid isomerase-like protein
VKANEAVMIDLFRAIEERDYERVLAAYDPDVEFVWPPSLPLYGGTYRGPTQVAQMTEGFVTAWDRVQPTPESRRLRARVVASNENEVVMHYHQSGIAPDGRICDTEVLGLYRLEDGKVVRLQMYYFEPEQVRDFLSAVHDSTTM